MNDIFSISRFFALARKDYRENRRFYFIFIGVMAVVILLAVTRFNPFSVVYDNTPDEKAKLDFINHYKQVYAQIFWGLLLGFTIIFAVRSFRSLLSPTKNITYLMLPVSTLERYLLVFFNCFIVLLMVHLLLFYGITSVTNSYKYVGLEQYHFQPGGWFGNLLPYLKPGQEVIHAEIGNVLNLLPQKYNEIRQYHILSGQEKDLIPFFGFFCWNMALCAWLGVVSIFMWGSITFRKYTFLLTILVHFLVFLALGIIGAYIVEHFVEGTNAIVPSYDLRIYGGGAKLSYEPSPNWLYLCWLFPVGYQMVIWWKLKTKQVIS